MASLHFAGETTSLDAIEARGARAAWSLHEMGVAEGASVALLMRNEPAFVEALTTIRCLHAFRVLIPWHLAPDEIGRILNRVRPSVLIVHADLLSPLVPLLEELPAMAIAVVEPHAELIRVYDLRPGCEPARPAGLHRWPDLVETASGNLPIPPGPPQAISLTSGSTGKPKVIRWQQHWEQRRASSTDQRPLIKTSIVTAPLFYGAQYGGFSQAWRLRADIVLEPKFDAESFLAAVERYHVNHAYLVPPMFVRLLRLTQRVRERYDLSSLNYVLHSGASCPANIKRAMIDWWGPILWEAYGCSETHTLAVCSSSEWLERPGTVGQPMKALAILNDCGQVQPAGEIGQIWASISNMPRIATDHHTPAARRIGETEMIATGDMGYLDDNDYLFVCGRADDLINTGRVKVYPAEIENAILQHPQVTDCVVFGVPDEEFGQVIGARLQVCDPKPDFESDLCRFLRARVSEHKIPVVMQVSGVPLRSEAGKFNRRELAMELLTSRDPLTV